MCFINIICKIEKIDTKLNDTKHSLIYLVYLFINLIVKIIIFVTKLFKFIKNIYNKKVIFQKTFT